MKQFILLYGLLIGVFTAYSQNLIYEDSTGNHIRVNLGSDIEDFMDSTFFVQHLKGHYFINSPHQWNIHIEELKKTKRNRYQLKVMRIPISAELKDILDWQGYTYYEMRIKRNKQKHYYVDEIRYLYSEI
ncbi:MAG: hypothetical protein MI810_13400 [Flavobacteriales bacterium]|nr:hypothetical protein [Flavobacteriales bacterium]